MTQDDVHGRLWWCGYDRAWMSATLKQDLDGESFVECLNCRGVLARLKREAVPV